jgi:hypothetical protein
VKKAFAFRLRTCGIFVFVFFLAFRPNVCQRIALTDKSRQLPRGGMSAGERQGRSRAAQLIHQAGLIRGTLLLRERVCGKPTCHCAKGERHVSLHLQISRNGKPQQVIVPRGMEDQVREWVANYHVLWEGFEAVSDAHWAKIAADKDSRKVR